MEINNQAGSIAVGKKANVIITRKVPSLAYLPYAFGTNQLARVIINGEYV
jgi:imidazolonepropionase